MAILALTAPLTLTLAINIYVAALCGGVGLTVLVLPLWGRFHRSASKPPPPSIALPTIPASSDLVTIRLSMSLRDRLVGTLLFIVALVSSGYIIVRSIGDCPDVWVRHTSDYDPHIIAPLLFFLCALILVQSRPLAFPDPLGPPLETCSRANEVGTRLERHTARSLSILQVIDRGEMAVGERSVGQRPEVFGRLELG